MTNSVDPNQLASEEASWSGIPLFARQIIILVWAQRGKIKPVTATVANIAAHYVWHFYDLSRQQKNQ